VLTCRSIIIRLLTVASSENKINNDRDTRLKDFFIARQKKIFVVETEEAIGSFFSDVHSYILD